LGALRVQHPVNLEIDTVARYVERMLQVGLTPKASA
jgi:riboflavin synthase alpha subunit